LKKFLTVFELLVAVLNQKRELFCFFDASIVPVQDLEKHFLAKKLYFLYRVFRVLVLVLSLRQKFKKSARTGTKSLEISPKKLYQKPSGFFKFWYPRYQPYKPSIFKFLYRD
jgi:hypothetical protein